MYGYPQPTYYDYIRQSMGQAPQPQSNVLPAQQVLKAKGRASIDTLQMAPNSSIFIKVYVGGGQFRDLADAKPHVDQSEDKTRFAVCGVSP